MALTHGHAQDTDGRPPPSPLFAQVCVRVRLPQSDVAEARWVCKVEDIMRPAAREFATVSILHPARVKTTIGSHRNPH